MTRLPGSTCAEALVRVGLPHRAVVQALVTELDLTTAEAELAWRRVALRQDELVVIRRALHDVIGGDRGEAGSASR
jgi:hypothetical protein